ncbi:hypothetical protein C8R45DRAFT_760595, partial [Mycena sanguinolenta]
CPTPHSCCARAKELLDTLPPKWDPRIEQPEAYELAPSGNDDGWITFDRRIMTISDVFRIFMEGELCNVAPD